MQGIDPRTSRMLSERSTIWATSPDIASVILALSKMNLPMFDILMFHFSCNPSHMQKNEIIDLCNRKMYPGSKYAHDIIIIHCRIRVRKTLLGPWFIFSIYDQDS